MWYVYARPRKADAIRAGIKNNVEKESPGDRYDFEQVLDECSYQYLEKPENPAAPEQLRQVQRN
ncbi:MAG TPA: hypothetical protein VFH28_00460 [Nitrososphaera sp.]|nr:hypothetical protein [Nitrososphaera sp.]